jgi:glutamine amidotransferase
MAGIEKLGAGPMIAERVRLRQPVLGVCVGMQIFFGSGVEHGVETKGLGLLPGVVSKIKAERIPHMGWNTVKTPDNSDLFAGIDESARFYFVHSYAAMDLDVLHQAGAKVTTASHDEPFAAAVELGSLAVAQFHPEKSADAGFALLRNWVAGL